MSKSLRAALYASTLFVILAHPEAGWATEPPGTKVQDSTHFAPDVSWSAFDTIEVGPTAFELNESHHRRTFDSRSRRWVDRTLDEEQRSRLGNAFYKTSLKALATDPEAKAGGHVLHITPVIVEVDWSRPPPSELRLARGVDSSSVAAGGARVRFVVRTGDASGPIVGTLVERWSGNLGDQQARVDVWEDAFEAFRLTSRRLRARLLELGVKI
ncbi:MAG: hypothetical protein AAF735_01400 [Myxococcota bacterium]